MGIHRIELLSREFGKIAFIPLHAPAHSNNDSVSFEASGPFGTIHLHKIKNANYNLWHSHSTFKQDTTLSISSDQEFLGLHFALKNNFHYAPAGSSKDVMLEHHYNMTYVPHMRCECTFQKTEEYVAFNIQFKLAYLQRWHDLLPLFSEFLNKARHKTPAMISKTHQPTAAEMSVIIQNMLHSPYTGSLKKIHLESKILDLLLLSLRNVNAHSDMQNVKLRQPDIKKIQRAREYLSEHIADPCTIEELAALVGTNHFRLRNGFKQLYGNTVFGFLYEERMQRARTLIAETDIHIAKIALAIGYKHLSNFTEAFKKKYGYPPSALRR